MGVKLEVFRMVLYLSFPVAMFWISNQAEYFEEYVIKRKRRSTHPMTTARGRSWKISRKGCGRSMKSGSCVRLSSDSTSCPRA